MNNRLPEFGFAKVKGFKHWPAIKIGEAKGKLCVKFFGCNQLGSVTSKYWSKLSLRSSKKFTSENYVKDKLCLEAIKEMIVNIQNREEQIRDKIIYNNAINYLTSCEVLHSEKNVSSPPSTDLSSLQVLDEHGTTSSITSNDGNNLPTGQNRGSSTGKNKNVTEKNIQGIRSKIVSFQGAKLSGKSL